MNFPEYIEAQFVKWQSAQGKRKTIQEFADYLEISQALLSMWMNGKRTPGHENIVRLAENFGPEVYDALGLARPDPDLTYIDQHWDELSPALRRQLREQAEKYVTDNEIRRIPEPRTKNGAV